MKDKKQIQPIFKGLMAVLLIILGIFIGIAIAKNSNSDSTEDSQNPGATTQGTQGVEGTDNPDGTQEADKQVEVPSTQIEQEAEKATGEETFVIFGVDSRTNQLGKGTRSDSIMIVHVNHENKTVKVASVFRDCMVHIDGRSKFEKITHAHSYGGPELALSTINENFDLKASNYITVNFNSVAKLVDMIDGIDYEITEDECKHMGSRFTQPGKYHLNGTEVVTYSRIRKAPGGDYKRSERQRDMLFEIFEKSKTLSTMERVNLVDKMIGDIKTNYKKDEIIKILYYLSKYKITGMDAFPKTFYGGTVEGAWVEVPVTLVDMNAALHKFLFGTTDYVPSEKVKEYSDTLRGKVSGANTTLK